MLTIRGRHPGEHLEALGGADMGVEHVCSIVLREA
jgi:hypothetical protein